MCALACGRAGDPLTFAACGSDAAIERSSEFEGNQWPPEAQPAEEAGVYLSRLLCAEPDLDIEPRRTQLLQPLACHARIWILKRNDHSLHARSDQSVDARW